MIADLHNICTKFVLHDLLSFRGLFKLTEKKSINLYLSTCLSTYKITKILINIPCQGKIQSS